MPELRSRRVRSYVLRTGRMTPGQQRALTQQFDRYGLTVAAGKLDPVAVFGRTAALVLEIGFGMGQSLAEMAAAMPERDFIGVDVHTPGVGSLLALCAERELDNLRVYHADAADVLAHCIADRSLAAVQIFFPDPWPKRRHHKRRLIQSPFVAQVARKLAPAGVLHLATDWEHYARQMLAVASAEPLLDNCAPGGGFAERPLWRPQTRFERRGDRLGHRSWDLLFAKAGD